MSSVAVEESSTPTDSAVYRLKHKWTIKDFASTYLVKSTNKENYPELCSTWFSSQLDSALKFRIILRPRGQDEESSNYLSLFLEMKRSGLSPLVKSVDVKFKFSLLNERNEECCSREFRQELDYPSDNYGEDTFLKHRTLQNRAKGLLPADTLTILVEVDVFPEHVIQQGNKSLLAKLQVESIENVKDTLAGILDNGEHSDVLLVVDGGTELAAHKVILSAHSPVFRGMFKTEMAEQMEGKVKIPDMKVEVAQALLRFIYTGETEDLEEFAEELLVAADKYDVIRLKALCSQYLCGQVDTANAARLFALADRHSVDQLESIAFDYIHSHLDDVLLTNDWHLVQELFTRELRQLKLKEKQGEKRKTPEESESVN